MRYRGHISSEAFPLNLELFLSGGAGAPPAPLAETPMSAACDSQSGTESALPKDSQSAACDFQPDVGNACPNEDLQGTACDFQPDTESAFTEDLQSAACDSQPEKAEKIIGDVGHSEKLKAISNEKKLHGQSKSLKLILGKNANEDLMNTTPVGIHNPKRRLVWSPETPTGRSRKYSIGEKASPSLKRKISGVLPINGRYAIPSADIDVETTILGIGTLDFNDDGQIRNVGNGEKKKGGSPVLKTGARTPKGRGRRNGSRRVDPKQKLISDMLHGKARKEVDCNSESGTQD